jgi:hypothetical protein
MRSWTQRRHVMQGCGVPKLSKLEPVLQRLCRAMLWRVVDIFWFLSKRFAVLSLAQLFCALD